MEGRTGTGGDGGWEGKPYEMRPTHLTSRGAESGQMGGPRQIERSLLD